MRAISLAHMSKLSSLLQFWAPAQYCERRKLRVLNVFSSYFIHSFRNQSRFIPNNNLFVFILPPCLLHLFLAQYFSRLFLLRRKEIVRKRGENTPFFHVRVLICTCAGGAWPNLISVLFPKKFMSGPYLSVLQKVQQQQW